MDTPPPPPPPAPDVGIVSDGFDSLLLQLCWITKANISFKYCFIMAKGHVKFSSTISYPVLILRASTLSSDRCCNAGREYKAHWKSEHVSTVAIVCIYCRQDNIILFQIKPIRCTLPPSIFISASLHVSSNCVPIIRGTYCICATLVFCTLYGWLSGQLTRQPPIQ